VHRYICRLGPVNLYSYGFMLALAFTAATLFAARQAGKKGIDRNLMYDLVLYILVGSIAGARLLFVSLNFAYYQAHPIEIFKLWEGGLVLYGGIVFGFITGIIYLRRARAAVWQIADIIAPALALGIAIGRIGCFLNGCCYGRVSRWGVRFPATDNPPAFEEQVRHGLIPSAAVRSLPVLPTQLYESLACLVLFGILLWAGKRQKHFDGYLFWLFIMLYSVQRFFMEGIRYYDDNFFAGPLTVGQLLSACFFLAALAVILINGKKSGRTA